MKRLVGGLIAAFALLMGATIYIAHRSWDGLVDRRYSEAASNEFTAREEESREGFTVDVTERYRAGNNRILATLATSAGPLRSARVTLDTMRIEGTRHDRTWLLQEVSPGKYGADVNFPLPGRWVLSLSVDAGRLHPRRRWAAVVPPSDAAGALRGSIEGREVLLSITPWPPGSMREVDFIVSLQGYAGTASPYVDLSMPGMEMGRNRVDLSRGADGRYRGKGVFVRCPSGRRGWEATVTAPGAGKAVFHLDVAD